mmetsp:Transcript_2004/g.6011  ORF Transcript_2004/g.6011 Transcript_2004/m.6011 type:complete len:216 (-) Transcript_2004:385-1032(-)
MFVPVLLKQLESLVCGKVLELNARIWPSCGHGIHPFVNKAVVLIVLQSSLMYAQISSVVEQLLIVRANINRDRKRSPGVDTSTCNVQVQLTYGNCHSIRAQISKSENSTAVGHDDDIHVVLWPIVRHRLHHSDVVDRVPHSLRASVDQVLRLARLSNSRSVDDRSQLREVLTEHLVEEDHVSVQQLLQERVFVDGLLDIVQGRNNAVHLHFHRLY